MRGSCSGASTCGSLCERRRHPPQRRSPGSPTPSPRSVRCIGRSAICVPAKCGLNCCLQCRSMKSGGSARHQPRSSPGLESRRRRSRRRRSGRCTGADDRDGGRTVYELRVISSLPLMLMEPAKKGIAVTCSFGAAVMFSSRYARTSQVTPREQRMSCAGIRSPPKTSSSL